MVKAIIIFGLYKIIYGTQIKKYECVPKNNPSSKWPRKKPK